MHRGGELWRVGNRLVWRSAEEVNEVNQEREARMMKVCKTIIILSLTAIFIDKFGMLVFLAIVAMYFLLRELVFKRS